MVKVAVDPVLRMEVMTTQLMMIVIVLTMINTKIIKLYKTMIKIIGHD